MFAVPSWAWRYSMDNTRALNKTSGVLMLRVRSFFLLVLSAFYVSHGIELLLGIYVFLVLGSLVEVRYS